jgi:hypothetical protein
MVATVLEFMKHEMEQWVEILCVWRGNFVLPDIGAMPRRAGDRTDVF